MTQSNARLLAIITMVVTLAALVIRFWLALTVPEDPAAAIWRLFGYFTILTNIAVLFASAAIAFRPESFLARPRARMSVAVAIALVGILYTLLLRSLYEPKGWAAVSNHGLHDVGPVLFVVTWLLCSHGTLRWKDAFWAILFPFVYCLYALVRGAIEGWYPYWFLDANKLGAGALVMYIAGLSATFLAFGFLFVGIDKFMARRRSG